jgi:hypothetical protein
MPLVYGNGEICGVILSLMMEIKAQEKDGLWNHLLLSKNTPVIVCGGEDSKEKLAVSGEVHISWSQAKEELVFKEGERFRAKVTADCSAGGGVDEDESDKRGTWVTYRVWTCTATEIEVLE